MVKRKVAALEKLDADLASLQYKIRRDPRSYREEFLRQWEQYESQRDIFLLSPTTATPDLIRSFHDVIDLIAHIADLYPADTGAFAGDLTAILLQHHAALHPELRDKIVGSLVLLRRKDCLSSADLLTTFFPVLIASPSKTLRGLIFKKILSDVRGANARATNHPLNRTVQTALHNLVTTDRTSPRALWAIKLTRELWKRQVWTDARPVQVLKEACLSDNEKVVVAAVRFFLGGDKEREEEEEEDDSSDEDAADLRKLKHQMGINKKTKKKSKQLEKAIGKVKRAEKKKVKPQPLNFSALHLLHDPQGFAETLFSKNLLNTKAKLALDSRLLVLQLVTRLVGLHRLTILPLYSWFTRFLTPRQQSVTSVLASLAQATHPLVPPDALEPLVHKIATEFVSEAAAAEVAAAGLNAIREVCARQPLAMGDTLLQDLVQFRRSKDKGVMMAARGLLSLYREVGADLLRRKDRGRDAAIRLQAAGTIAHAQFGEEATGGIEGIDLLENWKEQQREKREAEGLDAEGDDVYRSSEWEVASDDDDSGSDGWLDVEHSEDDAPAPKKRRKPESEIERLEDAKVQSTKAESAELGKGDDGIWPASSNRKTDRDLSSDSDSNSDSDSLFSSDEEEQDEVDATIDAANTTTIATTTTTNIAAKISTNATPNANTPNHTTSTSERASSEAPSHFFSSLATTSILTPADLAKLHELRTAAAVKSAMAGPKGHRHADDGLTAEQIELPSKLRKSTKEERLAAAREGRPERDEHQSTQAARRSRKQAEGKSTTNREKARKKHMLMTLGKAKAKQKRSLVQTQKVLRGHVERSKRGGRRGNGR